MTANVTADGPTSLEARVQGASAPGVAALARPGSTVGALAVDAGLDPGVNTVRVLAYLDRLSLAGSLRFHWKLLSIPTGSTATLQGADGAQPSLRPDLEGTYELEATVGYLPPTSSNGATTAAPITVSAAPDDPPLGVPIETLSSSAQGAIWINGQAVKDTSDRSGIIVAVLNRATREVVFSGAVARNQAGVGQLLDIVRRYTGSLGYLVILSDTAGVPDNPSLDLLAQVTKGLGHELSASERSRLVTYPQARFSLVGVPGGASNSAWMYSAFYGSGYPQGDMTGYLQINPATSFYGYVNAEYQTFDTQAPGSGGLTNVIQVGARTYSATLNTPGAVAGLHVLALDPFNLQPLKGFSNNLAWTTNTTQGGAGDREMQGYVQGVLDALALKTPANQAPPIVIVQSIGPVKPLVSSLGEGIAKIGGNEAVLNELSAKPGSYALVGRGIYGSEPAGTLAPTGTESSTSLDQSGELVGVLSRSTSYQFGPLLSDSPDGAGPPNVGLISVAYQKPQPFPAFTPPEQVAETYIGRQINLCTPDAPSCDVRRAYYEDYNANWQQKALDIARMTYPGGAAFTAAEFNAVKGELSKEVSDLNNVQHYLAKLQEPFQRSETRAYVDLQAIGDAIEKAVAPPQTESSSDGLALFAAFLNIAKVFFDVAGYKEVKFFLDAVGAGIGLVAALTRRDGSQTLNGVIRAKTSELATAILDRFDAAERQLTLVGLLIASDYGKLSTAAANINTAWKLPRSLAVATDALRLATQRFYYRTLIPIAYPKLIQITPPPPVGPDNARNLVCLGPLRKFTDEPDVGQDRQVLSFTPEGAPIRSVVFIRGRTDLAFGSAPNADLLKPIFDPAGPGLTGLGLSKLDFYWAPPLGSPSSSTTTWPVRQRAVDINDRSFTRLVCGLTP